VKPNVKPIVTQDVTVLDLPYSDVQVSDAALGSEVARIFEQNQSLPGIIVMNGNGFVGMVSRNQFFQRLGRPFGIEIYSPRAITFYLESIQAPPVVLSGKTTIQNAVIVCLARPPEHVYDPFMVQPEGGAPRLIDLLALILKQTELLTAAQIEAHAQRGVAIAASNAKSEFLANMSHELRTPLTAIIGYAEILMEDVATRDLREAPRRLESIATAGRHLLEMINGLLDLAKIEAGKMELFVTTYSLNDLVQEIAQIAKPLMAKNGNEFRVVAEQTTNEMRSDETKLRQCLINLLGNAAKFTTNGTIELAIRPGPANDVGRVVFTVTDTGIGMDETQLGRLFESFQQADNSISRRFGGTGLGLSITKQYCELMGGQISVRSVPGEGTIFTLDLPTRLTEPLV
jgi:signal transduction histidine kinase